MAHAGKYVPWTVKNRVVALDLSIPFYRPPSRKISVQFNALGNTGTFCTPWAGLTIVSSEADYASDDGTITTYTVVNPSDSSKTIEIRFKFRQIDPTPTVALKQLWDIWFIARSSASIVAEHHIEPNYEVPFVNGTYDVQIGPGWDSSVGLPVFQNLVTRLRAATWAQQPEYHPYRH